MSEDFSAQIPGILGQMSLAPGFQRLRSLRETGDGLDLDLVESVLREAAKFSASVLAPFEKAANAIGCQLTAGRVITAPGHELAWRAFCDGGWTGMDMPTRLGGQGMARIVCIACEEIFNRGSVSFCMLPAAGTGAARVLAAHADSNVADEWIPQLASGNWGATICISEPGAGSDVGRIRTSARRTADGGWRVSGEKCWISFGDHSLTERIGHLVLARPEGSQGGVRGLSLFLVPSSIAAVDGSISRNSIVVRRIEEKLGLHCSPTCSLGFEDAGAVLIGEEGRGLPQLFRMIVSMRLQVSAQGLGLATASFQAALNYARERRQGGPQEAPAVPIIMHPDIQRELMAMSARIETLRGLIYAAAIAADLAEGEPDESRRVAAARLLGWLLPIIKNSGAETAFQTASSAIQVFGGAGYTREWPVERYLRDARILAIYEGTTGMQALDLVRRRWLVPHTGFEEFKNAVMADLPASNELSSSPLLAALRTLDEATEWLRAPARSDFEINASANALFSLATEVAHGWIAARLGSLQISIPGGTGLQACGRHGLSLLGERIAGALNAVYAGSSRIREFPELLA